MKTENPSPETARKRCFPWLALGGLASCGIVGVAAVIGYPQFGFGYACGNMIAAVCGALSYGCRHEEFVNHAR